MVAASWAQIAAVFALLFISTPLLGGYLAKVYRNGDAPGDRIFLPVERLVYRLLRIDPRGEQRWIAFVGSAVALTIVGVLLNYLIFRLQHLLPGNPDHFRAVSPSLSFNTAVSFVTNTDWQNYTGESTMSQFSQNVRTGGAPVFVRGHGDGAGGGVHPRRNSHADNNIGKLLGRHCAVFSAGVGAAEFRVRHRAARGGGDRQLPLRCRSCRRSPR